MMVRTCASKEHSGQQVIVFENENKCDPGACVDVSLTLWFPWLDGTSSRYYATDDINCHDATSEIKKLQVIMIGTNAQALIPGSPYFYLEKFAQFKTMRIPQIDYEPVICSSN